MVVNYSPITPEERKKKQRWSVLKWAIAGIALLVVIIAVSLVLYEMNTSRFQSQEFTRIASSLTYRLESGPSKSIAFPQNGPFDTRLGYAQLPNFLDRAKRKGMYIASQASFSPELLAYTQDGYFTPYTEKMQTGLRIADASGQPLYQFRYPRRIYAAFDSIPPLIVNSLLFIENRELLSSDNPYMNPAVDWKRFSRASLHEAAKRVGLDYKTIGGSTLATQIEKYRHSPSGITAGPREKLQQMVSASVRAYQGGKETLPARKGLVLSYLNTVPLSGAPGYGEVHGLADGLWVWFNSDMEQVNQLLRQPHPTGDTLQAQGQALRQVLSLMIAQRRPSYYLGQEGHTELNSLTAAYLRLLASNNYIQPSLRDAGLAREVSFRDFDEAPAQRIKDTDKGALIARTHLSNLLGKSLYDLDRLDLDATATLQNDLQAQVTAYLNQLSDPEFAGKIGVLGDRMLKAGRTEEVRYSFTLLERTPTGNLVRVQTDNTDQPFDMNEGSKLELGSTAKLRVLTTYLQIIAEVHARYAGAPQADLKQALATPQDNLSRWVLQYLSQAKDKSLQATLDAALQRRYSASPYEGFFTGGGMHTFHNFQNSDNGRNPSVQEAFLKSINLPFIRLMRDVVRYATYQNVDNAAALLSNDLDPRRRTYLSQFADREGQTYLRRFWRKYEGQDAQQRFATLLNSMRKNPVRLAVVHRFLYPDKDLKTFDRFLREQLPGEKLKNDRVEELYERYGPKAYNLADQGYLSRAHPLELWLLQYMLLHPEATWTEVVKESEPQRREVYAWLFKTRFKSARDSRIRTMLELDAFESIQQRWQRLGYPFQQLVPSLATALGSSGDRPEALAELMGIILNNGVRQRTLHIESLHFAAHTPYETALGCQPAPGEQVLVPEVAATLKRALLEVVEVGTARRLQGGFVRADGAILRMGGKTGTGDNRMVTLSSRGHRITSRAVNRTATFVFFLGDRHFGTLTAFVPGREAADFGFTSSLPVQVLRGMEPILEPYLNKYYTGGAQLATAGAKDPLATPAQTAALVPQNKPAAVR
ncbi:transglycosylase domain-containing protein [Pontibacter sp. E15-1]|uniref:transglycosylase domain-containing protein n=1 Tax=Pontibacter sp. E15-1 TaxID=2919918 RepID=UPI001F4FED8C|nr:transglycosylase domain-containing protein [Pontibacter sp. E15-1]MCJ8165019.1 transglycosylase domain-containing protein [Pontibacter sp. E15-1]